VGTNRDSYSFNDPVNLSDPSGNETVYSDQNGDGFSTYYGEIIPGDVGFGRLGDLPPGISGTDLVDLNNAYDGLSVPGCTGCELGGLTGLEAYQKSLKFEPGKAKPGTRSAPPTSPGKKGKTGATACTELS
jgi:hypothetical protein